MNCNYYDNIGTAMSYDPMTKEFNFMSSDEVDHIVYHLGLENFTGMLDRLTLHRNWVDQYPKLREERERFFRSIVKQSINPDADTILQIAGLNAKAILEVK